MRCLHPICQTHPHYRMRPTLLPEIERLSLFVHGARVKTLGGSGSMRVALRNCGSRIFDGFPGCGTIAIGRGNTVRIVF